MKAITLWPEWAWAIRALDKRVENRTWALPVKYIGQRVLLHAGAANPTAHGNRMVAVVEMAKRAGWRLRPSPDGFDPPILTREGRDVALPRPYAVPYSALVGVLTFTACDAPREGDLSGWRAPDRFGWRFAFEPMRPILCAGKLGFWRVDESLVGGAA